MPTCKATCKGNNQLGKPGHPLGLLEAQFRDEEGEPIIGMPVRFDLVKGEGELMASDERTDLSGGVCAEFIPGNMTGRGRIELRYGDDLEHMTPFLFSMEEEEAKVEPPPIVPTMPLPKAARHPSGVNVQALAAALAAPQAQAQAPKIAKNAKDPHKTRMSIPVLPDPRLIEAERAFFARTADRQPTGIARSKAVPMLIAVMLLALTVPVYAVVKAVNRPAEVPVGFIADCTQGAPPHAEGHQLVYDSCPLVRK